MKTTTARTRTTTTRKTTRRATDADSRQRRASPREARDERAEAELEAELLAKLERMRRELHAAGAGAPEPSNGAVKMLIQGLLILAAGIGLTVASGGQAVFYGAILVGAIWTVVGAALATGRTTVLGMKVC